MKRQTKLLILVIILAVCVGGYAIISSIAKKNEEKESLSQTEGVVVTDFAANQVGRLEWTYENNRYIVTNTDGYWYNDADETFPVRQAMVTNMAAQVSGITASTALTGVENFAEYGLTKPSMEISLMSAAGGELTFAIGDKNPVTADYYMQITSGAVAGQENVVYLIPQSVVNAFSYTMDELLQMEEMPDLAGLQSVKVTMGQDVYRISYMGDDLDFPWTVRDEAHGKLAANTNLCNALATNLSGLHFVKAVEYKAATADLTAYGLDVPWAVVEIEYATQNGSGSDATLENHTLTLSFGNADENGNTYLLLDGYQMLYAVDDVLPNWLRANNFDTLSDITEQIF